MSEVCTPPATKTDHNGDEWVTFGPDHTLADIARWIARNKVDAEEMIYLLLEMVASPTVLETIKRISRDQKAALERLAKK